MGLSPEYLAYKKRHRDMHVVRGRAAEHMCVECGEPARDWATIKGKDGSRPEDYQAMCRGCHMRYDEGARVIPLDVRAARQAAYRESLRIHCEGGVHSRHCPDSCPQRARKVNMKIGGRRA